MRVATIASSTTDEAVEALRPFFPALSLDGAGEDPLALHLDAWQASGVVLTEYSISGRPVRGASDAPGFAVAETRGSATMSVGRDTVDTALPYAVPHVGLQADMEHLDARIVHLDEEFVQRFVRTDLGDDRLQLRSVDTAPHSPEAGHLWHRTVEFARARMIDGSADDPLIGVSLSQLLTSVYLHSFRTTWSGSSPVLQGSSVGPAVRRATTFIDDSREQPLGLADIAAAARLSIRGLQAAFQRELGTTPLGYLRRARFAGARDELLAADPAEGATVAAVARRWGFPHLGRFAVSYREQFGESPSATRRR